MAQPVAGIRGELGVQNSPVDRVPDLARYLTTPDEPPLDLRDGWMHRRHGSKTAYVEVFGTGNLCGGDGQRCFFAATSPAGAAFDYLEYRSKVSVRVLELLDLIAAEAFAKGYRIEFPDYYKHIDFLFRCRNKIAHRGELNYRDDSGNSHQATKAGVAEWWASVAHLRTWLDSL